MSKSKLKATQLAIVDGNNEYIVHEFEKQGLVAKTKEQLKSAISKLSSSEGTIIVVDNIIIDEDITVPENVMLKFYKGGKLTVNSGCILTLDCAIDAGLFHIFDGNGTIDLSKAVKSVITVDTIKELVLKTANIGGIGCNVNVLGYHEPGDGGGGYFYWGANEDKANHNGGTIIDPNIAFPTDWINTTQQSIWFTAGTGSGCWKRIYDGAVNVKWFGAKGDGVFDNSIIFNKVFNLPTNSFHIVYIPKGEYKLNTSFQGEGNTYAIILERGDIKIYGDTNSVIKLEGNVSFGFIENHYNDNVIFENLIFDGTNCVLDTSDRIVIHSRNVNDLIIRNCKIINFDGWGFTVDGKNISYPFKNIIIENNEIYGIKATGIFVAQNTDNVKILNNICFGKDEYNTIDDRILVAAHSFGSFDYIFCSNVEIRGNIVGTTHTAGIKASGKNIIITDNIIQDVNIGIQILSEELTNNYKIFGSSDVIISNNVIKNPNYSTIINRMGMKIQNVVNAIINNNNIVLDNENNNVITGIQLEQLIQNVKILNNTISNSSNTQYIAYGILTIYSTVNTLIIKDNLIEGPFRGYFHTIDNNSMKFLHIENNIFKNLSKNINIFYRGIALEKPLVSKNDYYGIKIINNKFIDERENYTPPSDSTFEFTYHFNIFKEPNSVFKSLYGLPGTGDGNISSIVYYLNNIPISYGDVPKGGIFNFTKNPFIFVSTDSNTSMKILVSQGGATSGNWSSNNTYKCYDWVTGSDGKVYMCIKNGGEQINPTSDTTNEYWKKMYDTIASFN